MSLNLDSLGFPGRHQPVFAARGAAIALTVVEPATSSIGGDAFALNILDGLDLAARPRGSAESFHLQIEATKLAFADVTRYTADPARAAAQP